MKIPTTRNSIVLVQVFFYLFCASIPTAGAWTENKESSN